MTLHYCQPHITNAQQLSEFFAHSFKENFPYFPEEAFHHFQAPWQLDTLRARLEQPYGYLCCAFDGDNIVGLTHGTAPEGGVATIIWLFVAKSHQNRGIGTQLLMQAKQHYRACGAHKLKLTVHEPRALNFYLREQFIQEAFHEKHWWQLDFWSVGCFL